MCQNYDVNEKEQKKSLAQYLPKEIKKNILYINFPGINFFLSLIVRHIF